MASSPRRIGKLVIELDIRNNGWDEQTIEKVKRVALTCPVAKSVSEDIELEITFHV